MCLCTKKKPSLVKIALGLGLATFGYVCVCAISDLIKEWPIDPNDEKPEVDEDGMTTDAANDATNANDAEASETEDHAGTDVADEVTDTDDDADEIAEPADEGGDDAEDSPAVYGTPNGKTYHATRDCTALSRSKNIVEMTEDEAVESGKVPCGRCMG